MSDSDDCTFKTAVISSILALMICISVVNFSFKKQIREIDDSISEIYSILDEVEEPFYSPEENDISTEENVELPSDVDTTEENDISTEENVELPSVSNLIIEKPIPQEEKVLPEDDVELIALLTMGEAEGECEEGKRLVIDTILNRADHPSFPNTIKGVIYQAGQFTPMWNGRIERCEVREDICNLVREEMVSRTNSDVIFFRTGRYSDYGTPMFELGCHYFSSYDRK